MPHNKTKESGSSGSEIPETQKLLQEWVKKIGKQMTKPPFFEWKPLPFLKLRKKDIKGNMKLTVKLKDIAPLEDSV